MNPTKHSQEHTETSNTFTELKKVTPVSKYLAMVLFILLPFVGGWIGYQYAPDTTAPAEKAVVNTDADVQTKLTSPSEWFEEQHANLRNSTATVSFTGTYRETEKSAWGDTRLCQQLYLRQYPQNDLHEYYVYSVLNGNTVQQFGEHGLLLNLPWEEIPEADQARIRQATSSPITVTLQQKTAEGTEAPACYSFFNYRGVEETAE